MIQDAAPLASAALKTTAQVAKDAPANPGETHPLPVLARLPITLVAGAKLNANDERKPLSLVVRIYQLRSVQSFHALTHAEAISPERAEEVLGTDLVSMKEFTVLPGKRYEFKPRLASDTQAIGVVGLFHSPAGARWKLAFDAEASLREGITIGAHPCALTAGHGVLIEAPRPDAGRAPASQHCGG